MKIEPSSLLMRTAGAFAPLSRHFQLDCARCRQPGQGERISRRCSRARCSVDAQNQASSERMRPWTRGVATIGGAMLSSQEASLSFSMLMQVRNKVMGAVDEVIKLQV
jgi:flagellar hook-basal body complex protein FliE